MEFTVQGGDYDEPTAPLTPKAKLLLAATTLLSTVFCLVGGSLYAFSSFSPALQAYGYSHVALLGSLGNCGMFVMGYFAGVSIDRFGQKIVCAVGVAFITIGYLLLRGAVLGSWSEGVVGLAMLIIGTGGISSLMSMLTWLQSQYSMANRGKITALLLASYSLSGAMWAPIYEGGYARVEQLPDYCLAVAMTALVLGLFVILLTGRWNMHGAAHVSAVKNGSEAPALQLGSAQASKAMEEQAVAAAWESLGRQQTADEASAWGVSKEFASAEADASTSAAPPATGNDKTGLAKRAPAEAATAGPKVLTVLFCTSSFSVIFWMLYLPVFVVLGAAFVYVNNTALIVDALRGVHDPARAAESDAAAAADAASLVRTCTIVFGVCNSASRVGGGWLTDIIAARGKSRLWIMLVADVLAIVACFVLASSGLDGLMLGTVLMGLGDGLCFAVWPVMTREAFGKLRYGRFYGLLNSAVGFGSMAFNAMASSMYHDAGHTFRDPDGSSRFVCNGPVCFEKTFTTSGVLCIFFTLIPTLVLLWFLARQKKASGAQERVSMASLHDAVEGANQLSSQVEIDMELIHMDETADTGAHDLLDIIRHKSSARRAAPVASGSKA